MRPVHPSVGGWTWKKEGISISESNLKKVYSLPSGFSEIFLKTFSIFS